MSRRKKLLSDTLIIGIGTFGSKLLVFVLMPLYTAYLSAAQYGTAELITGTANLLIPFACVGITNGVFRFCAERGSDKAAVLSSSVAILGIGSGIFLLLAQLLNLTAYFRGYVWLILLYVVMANLQAVCAQYVRAIDRTRLFAVQGILNTFITAAFNVFFLVVCGMGVIGYVLSVILGNLITTIFLAIRAKMWKTVRFSCIDRELMRELVRFSLPLVPTTVCWLITDISDRYLVTYFWGDAVNGVYSAAYKIPTLLTVVSGIFMQAWQLSAVAESEDRDSCKHFYSEVFGGFLSVVSIGAAGLILLSPVLTSLLLNPSYAGAAYYMPTLILSAALSSIVSFLASAYMVTKKSMNSFLTAISGAVLNLLLNLLLIPRMGAIGAAVATLASYGLVLLLRLIDVPRLLAFRLYLPRLIASLALLVIVCTMMTVRPEGWWNIIAFFGTFIVTLINVLPLWRSLLSILRRRRITM